MRYTSRRLNCAASLLISFVALSAVGVAHAQVIFTSTTAPVAGANDVYDLNANGGFDGSRDFTDNAGTPGETFTPTVSGSVSSVTVKGVGAGSGGGFATGNWFLRLSTLSGTTLTNSTTYSFAAAPTANSADAAGTANAGWLTFDLPTSYAVTAGTTYAYDIYSSNGFYGFARDFTHVGVGGAFNTGAQRAFTSTTTTPYTPATVNRTFIAGITAPTPIVASSAAPTIGTDTIAQTGTNGAVNTATDYSDNATPGQVFTTGANALGYKLNSITLLGRNDAGTVNGISYNTGLWHLRISSISGTTLTPVGFYAFDPTSLTAASASQYLTFALPSLNLNASTAYAFDVESDNGFYGFSSATTVNDIGSVGSYFNTALARSFDSQAATVTTGVQRTFYAGLTAITGAAAPEPSSLALLAGFAGTFGLGMVRRRRA